MSIVIIAYLGGVLGVNVKHNLIIATIIYIYI